MKMKNHFLAFSVLTYFAFMQAIPSYATDQKMDFETCSEIVDDQVEYLPKKWKRVKRIFIDKKEFTVIVSRKNITRVYSCRDGKIRIFDQKDHDVNEIAPFIATSSEGAAKVQEGDARENNYATNIVKLIYANVDLPESFQNPKNKVSTEVSFKVDASGVISNIKIEKSSGIPEFDIIAKNSVIKSSPLPPTYDNKPHSYSQTFNSIEAKNINEQIANDPVISQQAQRSMRGNYIGRGEGNLMLIIDDINLEMITQSDNCAGSIAGKFEYANPHIINLSQKSKDGSCSIVLYFDDDYKSVSVNEGDCQGYHGVSCSFEGVLKKK